MNKSIRNVLREIKIMDFIIRKAGDRHAVALIDPR